LSCIVGPAIGQRIEVRVDEAVVDSLLCHRNPESWEDVTELVQETGEVVGRDLLRIIGDNGRLEVPGYCDQWVVVGLQVRGWAWGGSNEGGGQVEWTLMVSPGLRMKGRDVKRFRDETSGSSLLEGGRSLASIEDSVES